MCLVGSFCCSMLLCLWSQDQWKFAERLLFTVSFKQLQRLTCRNLFSSKIQHERLFSETSLSWRLTNCSAVSHFHCAAKDSDSFLTCRWSNGLNKTVPGTGGLRGIYWRAIKRVVRAVCFWGWISHQSEAIWREQRNNKVIISNHLLCILGVQINKVS